MSVIIAPTDDKDLTRITLSGTVTLTEFVKALDTYAQSGPTRLELYDASGLEGERFSVDDIDSLVDYMRTYPARRPAGGKTAFLVSKTVDIGLTRMLALLSDDIVSFKTEVFRSEADALVWLNE